MNFSVQDHYTLKVINHGRKISKLTLPLETWFDDLLGTTGLRDLTLCQYSMVNWGMTNAFVERWHEETSLFHLPHREMTITLDDVACLLDLPIRGRFLDHEKLEKDEMIEMLVERLGLPWRRPRRRLIRHVATTCLINLL